MKRIKLLLAAFAAMVGLGAQAQSWTGNEVAEGTFYLYNVGAAKFINNGDPNESWGTNAYLQAGFGLDIKFEAAANGAYNLNTNVSNGGSSKYLATSTWCDGAATPWTFTAVEGEENTYTISNGDSYLVANDALDDIAYAALTGDSKSYWKLVSEDDFKAAMVAKTFSATEPMDVSVFIKGRSFARNDGRNSTWVRSYNGGNVQWIESYNNKYFGNEYWNNTFDIHQDIVGLPDGTYEVQCSGFGSNGTTFIYGNTKEAALTTENSAANGSRTTAYQLIADQNAWAGQTTGTFTLSGGSLTVGLKRTTNKGGDWAVFDEFRLYYYGLDLSEFAATLAAAVAEAEAVEGTVPAAVYSQLAAVVTEQNKSYTTAAEYTAATNAIEAAIQTMGELQSAYSDYIAVKTAVEALDDDATIFTGDAAVDVSAADAAVEAATTVGGINEAITMLRSAAATFIDAVTVNEGQHFDITNVYLTNADFEVPTANQVLPPGWTITITGQNCGQQNRTDTNPETGLAITNFIEAWHPSQLGNGVIAQTVSGLPEGTYVLECDASICHDPAGADDITGANLFIQSPLKTERQAISNVRLYINHYTLSFVHGGEGDVTFGLEANNTNANWLSADNFKVYFAGGIDYAALLATAVAEFEARESESDATIYATYKAIVDENNKTWNTKDEYKAAITAISAATEALIAANSAKSVYDTALAAANAAKAAEANANVSGSELTALNAAIEATPEATAESYTAAAEALNTATAAFTAAAASYDAYVTAKAETEALFGSDLDVAAPTTAAEAAAAPNAFNVAQYNKVATDYPYSLSSKIGEFNTWTGTATSGGAEDTPQTLSSEHWSAATHTYYEQGKNGWAANSFTVTYTKTTELPAGEYVIKVAARASGNVTGTISATATENIVALPNVGAASKGITTDGEASFDEGTFAKDGVGFGWQWRFLPFTLDEDGEVTITINAASSSQYGWVSIADGELLSAQNIATAVAYDEADDNIIEDVDVANVTIARNVKEGFNTVVLPFDLTEAQVNAAFGTGAEVYAFSESSEDANDITINFTKVSAGTITANVPYLVKATAASTEQEFQGVQVVAPTEGAIVEGTNANFIGVFGPTTVAEGDYFIGNGALYKSAGNTNIKAFRAYIKVSEGAGEVKLFIDGVETAISEINGVAVENGAVYNLAGQRVQKAQKGIFIVGGKKVVVK